jgi:hypothetical protein
MLGDEAQFAWSPGGRYLAIQHVARNQFTVISIVDLGSPTQEFIQLGRIVQATPDRFNSFSPVWGKSQKDFAVEKFTQILNATSRIGATALFFLSDRDVKMSEPSSPWGTRAPQPHFNAAAAVFVLPLQLLANYSELSLVNSVVRAAYGGGGASEVSMKGIKELEFMLETFKSAALVKTDAMNNKGDDDNTTKCKDASIEFGEEDGEVFARRAYRIGSISSGTYTRIICQLSDDPVSTMNILLLLCLLLCRPLKSSHL